MLGPSNEVLDVVLQSGGDDHLSVAPRRHAVVVRVFDVGGLEPSYETILAGIPSTTAPSGTLRVTTPLAPNVAFRSARDDVADLLR